MKRPRGSIFDYWRENAVAFGDVLQSIQDAIEDSDTEDYDGVAHADVVEVAAILAAENERLQKALEKVGQDTLAQTLSYIAGLADGALSQDEVDWHLVVNNIKTAAELALGTPDSVELRWWNPGDDAAGDFPF